MLSASEGVAEDRADCPAEAACFMEALEARDSTAERALTEVPRAEDESASEASREESSLTK